MKKDSKNGSKPGKGHEAHFRCVVQASIKMGDEPEQKFDLTYDVRITVEQIEYAVRQVAGTIARVASRVAESAPAQTETASAR